MGSKIDEVAIIITMMSELDSDLAMAWTPAQSAVTMTPDRVSGPIR